MRLRLSKSDLVWHKDCICPNNRRRHQHEPAFKRSPLVLLIILNVIAVVALFSKDLALFLLVSFLVCSVCALLYRLIRGHSLRCSAFWGFAGGVWWVVNVLLYGW